MGINWEYLRGVTGLAAEWGEAEVEELFQNLAGVSKLKSRDKTVEKLELLFTLTQAVMISKHSQVITLEEEIAHLAESAGRGDAQREQELEAEVLRLRELIDKSHVQSMAEEENMAYDWSSGWRLRKKEMEEAIHRKNNEIQQFMDDLQVCENERSTLRSAVEELEERLSDATREINSITSDYLGVKESLSHAQESLVLAREEIKGLKSHTEELTATKAQVQQKYDELSSAVDAKVNQLKVVVSQREDELQRLRSQLYQRSLNVSTAVSLPLQNDMSQVIHLEQECKEKGLEIARLQEKLSEASSEIESSALLIAKLKKSRMSAVEGEAAVISQLRGELHEAQEHMQKMRAQLLAAEEDAQLHAHDLSIVIGELQSYMAGEFSLADAVRELKEARNQVRVRESQITQLTSLVNSLQININDLIEENGELREQLKLEPREDIDLPGVNKTNWQDSKKIIDRLTNQVTRLQDEKVTLRTKVYELTRELSNTRHSLQVTSLEAPKRFPSVDTIKMNTQPLEEQLNHLSAAVSQLVQEKERKPTEDYEQQLEELKERCHRLEGEKSSLEKILVEDRAKKKVLRETETSYEEMQDKGEGSEETKLEPNTKSPITALNELIAALGSLPPSTEEVIAKLKNQVNYLIQECNKREEEINQREKTTFIYTRQFNNLRQQVSELNEQFCSEKEKWSSEKERLIKEAKALEDELHAQQACVGEMKAAMDVISSGQEGADTKIAHRLAELRYDLEVLKRKNGNQGKEITELHQRLKEKIQTLQSNTAQEKQSKNASEQEQELLKHRISRLEEELSQSVPRTMADETAAQMANITAKYRSLLQDQALIAQEREGESAKDLQIKQLTEEREHLSQLLESAREKVHSLQASLNLAGTNTSNIQVEVLAKQLAAVELRELREKQKADHSTVMYQNIKRECEELEHRVKQLQSTVDNISKMNLTLQTTEVDLRQKLQGIIEEEEYRRVVKELQQVKEENSQLSLDVQRLQNLSEVADLQLKQKQMIEAIDNLELEQLRQKAHDLAAISDERTKIGELHQDIVILKVKNLELMSELEEVKAVEEKQNMKIIRMSHQLRDRDRLLETSSDANRTRAIRLHAIVRDLRQQYAGAVPLSQQELMVDLMETIKQERNTLLSSLQSAQHDKMEAKVALRQLKVKQESLEELRNAFESVNATKHVSSWCSKLEEAKLKKVELEEKVQSLEEEKVLFRTRIAGKEKRLGELQAQLSGMEKMRMDEQLVWDQREAELTRALEEHESRHQKAVLELKLLGKPELPDKSEPLCKQLEQALDALRNKSALLEKLESEIESVKNESHLAKKELREKEIAIVARDQVINELRVKGSKIKVQNNAPGEIKGGADVNKFAREDEGITVVINGLKERLQLSQEAVKHYQDLLSRSHSEQQSSVTRHKEEVLRLVREKDESLAKVRELQAQLNDIPTRDPGLTALSEAQITQIHNLEDTIKTLDSQLEETRNEMLLAQGKVAQLERELTVSRREHSEEREHMEVSSQVRAQQHQRELDRLSGEMNNVRNERDDLRKEVALLKETASRTPSAILRTLVEKLRDQLIEKEKQVAKLSYAVQEMKDRISSSSTKDDEQNFSAPEKDVVESTSQVTEPLKLELEKMSQARDDLEKSLQQQVESYKSKYEQSNEEIDNMKEDLKNLKSHNLKVEKQMLQQKKNNTAMKQKLEDLEGRSPAAIIRTMQNLKEKLEKMDAAQEVEEIENRKARNQEQIVRWEERKKSKSVIDKLKNKVKELEDSVETSKKKLETSQDLLSRVEKEKLSLQFKLNNINKVSMEKMCGVCLKTLNPLEMGGSSVNQEESSPSHGSRSLGKTFRQMRVSPSPDRARERKETMSRATSPVVTKKYQNEGADSEMKLRTQLKKSLDDKHRLETKLKGAVEEVAALRKCLQQKEEEEERMVMERRSTMSKQMSGATIILEYESRILSLEEEIRQKSRLLAHVKQVVREAAAREETLLRDKESLFKRVTLLESVSEDTPSARLIHELRHAKLTVTRLQRHIDELQCQS